MTANSKFSRLASIRAISEATIEPTQSVPSVGSTPAMSVDTTESSENTIIYRLVAELERDDLDKFLDYKHSLTSTYGSCSNKDVIHEMLTIVYGNISNIQPRPESVRMREQTYSRKAVKRSKR